MRRYIKYILISLATVLLASCVKELELAPSMSDSELTTLVPRVKSFANQYITKADYTGTEKTITSLSVLVFDDNGNLVDTQTGTSTVTINKTMLKKKSVTAATIVMFANISPSDIKDAAGNSINSKTDLTLADVGSYTCHFDPEQAIITSLDNFTGFPMMGIQEGVNLTPTSAQQNAIQVDLKILYAKINFEIAVAAGSENANVHDNAQTFTLTGYSVNNVSTSTPLTAPAAGAATSSTSVYMPEPVTGSASGSVDLNSTQPLKFTFYMAESRYNHNLTNLEGIYPDDQWLTEAPEDDVKGYYSLTDEQKALQANKLNGVKYIYDDLIQQYKPKLANVDGATPGKGLATYVTVKGTYTDYRGTQWAVNYDIYLGKDNAQDFHVDRNSEYTNILTIKGIRNNNDYTGDDVWIDHRVDVSTTSKSGNITITRETLIDSHIEVRPLRIKLNPNQYSGARLYAPNVNWVGVERFTGKNCQDGSVYCYKGNESIGKRKYFTTTLISELKGIVGDSGYITLMDGECAWIYFDENTGTSDRTTDIIVEFFDTEGNSAGSETYTIIQRGLQTVGNHSIESYEEYLHTYDSADKYSLSTSPVDYTQQGFSWGLSGKKLSKDVLVSAAPLYGVEVLGQGINMQDVVSQRYDFLHSSDQPSGNTYYPYVKNGNTWNLVSFETGLNFTSRASANEKMTIMDMGTIPSSAYQYCLSKNKFKEDASGNHTMDIHWYLPDVNELKAILAANSSSADLSSDSYYWSSQPSYTGFGLDQLSDLADLLALVGVNLGNVDVKDEVTTSARAVAKSAVTDIARNENHRIRCLYSSTGIKNVDMSERAPDGMGGIFNFWMKGWTDGGKSTAGFFNYMLPSPSTPTGDTQTSTIPNVTFPTKENSQSSSAEFPYIVTEGKNGQIEGFQINPGDKNNWSKYSLSSTHYYTLRDYPGLSDYTLDKASLTDAYEETSTRKSITQTSLKTSTVEKTQSLPSTFALNPLNEKLTITFDQCDGSSVPVFTYDELYSQVNTTSVQYWNKPVYTGTTHELTPQSATLSSSGTGSETGISTGTSSIQQASESDAKKVAFDGTQTTSTLTCRVDGAYPKAKNDAKSKLDELLKNYPTSDGWVHGTYEYTQLSWDQVVSNIQWSNLKTETKKGLFSSYTSKVTITCTVTVTGSVIVTKPGSKTLYLQVEGTGNWSPATTTTKSSGPTVNTDQLRVYCGNSLTISVNAANANDYVISKVKVYISGGNRIKNVPVSSDLTTDNYYARFVDSALIPSSRGQIAYAEQGRFDYGSGEYIVLEGMEYSGDSTDSAVWQQWTGYNSSVTLVLADYKVATRAGFNAKYTYQTADTDKSKYIIIDRIEVKCTKKAAATTE